jgi:hypothetical protein
VKDLHRLRYVHAGTAHLPKLRMGRLPHHRGAGRAYRCVKCPALHGGGVPGTGTRRRCDLLLYDAALHVVDDTHVVVFYTLDGVDLDTTDGLHREEEAGGNRCMLERDRERSFIDNQEVTEGR